MRSVLASFALLLALSPAVFGQDEKLFKNVSPSELEGMLKRFDVGFKKAESKVPGIGLYDFSRKNFNVRLYSYEGKDLMLDAVFPKTTLEKVNEWNLRAKFSRAGLRKDPKGEFVTLEANLDLMGGAAEGTIRQFVLSFDDELATFARFLGDTTADDVAFAPVTAEKIEKVLVGLGVKAEKQSIKGSDGHFYDFDFEGRKVRLVNFGGKDLMIDAHFKKIPLADVNRFNLEKKFLRAVAYEKDGAEYVALEANLDCEAGTSEGILRNFIAGFQDDLRAFAKFVQGR